ncbi:hypothetical protein [Flavobacterium sp.]|uniref:hypothetical protein n=1 Tax=Flavobacterium sp. TaxID=239 RepID=UPI003751C5A7
MIEINSYSNPNGLNAGLNKGLKVGKFLKKNVRMRNVSLKNAIKVGKFVAPIASSFIPGGAIAGKGIKLLSKAGKVGRFATKVASSKAVRGAVRFAKNPAVRGFIPNLASREMMPPTTTDYGSEQANFDAPMIQQGGQAIEANVMMPPNNLMNQNQMNAQPNGMLPVREITSPEMAVQRESESPLNAQPKNNTMLYVGGGIALLGIIYLATKKK